MDNKAHANTSGYPDWFRLEPDGPHRRSGGLDRNGYDYAFYCAKDGQRWPCDTTTEHATESAS